MKTSALPTKTNAAGSYAWYSPAVIVASPAASTTVPRKRPRVRWSLAMALNLLAPSVPYNSAVTVKDALKERIDRLSEEEAAEWLARMEREATDAETLTEDEMARVLAAEREFAEGKSVSGDEVFRKLGL